MNREALSLPGARELLSKVPVLVIVFALTVGACSGGSPNGAARQGHDHTVRRDDRLDPSDPCGHWNVALRAWGPTAATL